MLISRRKQWQPRACDLVAITLPITNRGKVKLCEINVEPLQLFVILPRNRPRLRAHSLSNFEVEQIEPLETVVVR